jgi:hypothetical protein
LPRVASVMHPGCLIPALSHSRHSSRYSQPSCPAMPTAQNDGQSLGPACQCRRVRRPSRSPDRVSESPVSTGNLKMNVDGCVKPLESTGTPHQNLGSSCRTENSVYTTGYSRFFRRNGQRNRAGNHTSNLSTTFAGIRRRCVREFRRVGQGGVRRFVPKALSHGPISAPA